jgi:signal transduction histidine kinase
VVRLLTVPVSFINYRLATTLIAVVTVTLFFPLLGVIVKAWLSGFVPVRFLALGYGIFWLAEALRQSNNLDLLDFLPAANYSAAWSLLMATPLIFLALVERSRDMGQRLKLEQDLSRAKSEFLGRVGHDLRSPLNIMVGYARMLQRGSTRLSAQEGLADIEKNGLRLHRMIDELLDQSHLDAGRTVLQPQAMSLKHWLDNVERCGKLLSQATDNTFVVVRGGGLPASVQCDEARLHQIVDNLVTNANRHTRKGRIELRCQATPADALGRIRLEFAVQDTGEGISPADQAHIFEPFVRGNDAADAGGGRREGLGLGLAIARDLVRLMGGELTVASQVGVGSTFSFVVDSVVCELEGQSSQQNRPDAHYLQELLTLARAGEVTGIEDWCGSLAQRHPEYASFAAEVANAVHQLDFESVESLAQRH